MIRRPRHIAPAAALALALTAPLPAAGQEPGDAVQVPSGQDVRFVEVLSDSNGAAGLVRRFRFVAPAIRRAGGSVDFDTAAVDMDFLCRDFALQRLPAGEAPGQIVISLSDRPVAFGTPAPDATQYFEAYSVENGECVWEGF